MLLQNNYSEKVLIGSLAALVSKASLIYVSLAKSAWHGQTLVPVS